MTILTNIEHKVVILKNINYLKSEIVETEIGIIDVDYSLIRYLGNELKLKEVTLNNSGYPIMKKDDVGITTLYRVILNFYSKYDDELKDILKNTNFEINHKNKNKLDNRIENLEIVTHKNNLRHSMGLDYDVIIPTKRLLEIQNRSKESKQQKVDRDYLSRISGLWYKNMKNNSIDEKLLKLAYFSFINAPNSIANHISKRSIFRQLSYFRSLCHYTKFSYKFH